MIVTFTLPYTTNEMISVSTLQTVRSWVVIFLLRQPTAFLSLSLTIRPGLVLVWMFYSGGPATFQKATQTGFPRRRLKSSFRKFDGRNGNLIQQYEVSLARILNDNMALTSYRDFPTDQTSMIAVSFLNFSPWIPLGTFSISLCNTIITILY